jgi:T5SS/PEP-CTERM-associated repeat protein
MITGQSRHSWLVLLLMTLLANPVIAAISQTGNVVPNVSNWTGGTVGRIGSTTDGSVTVDAGSLLMSRASSLGENPGATGTATVSGAGSKWTNSNPLFVGYAGTGSLIIEAGGEVSNTRGHLGYRQGSTGTATVTGASSQWTNTDALFVGYDGTGSLTVSDGGQVVAKTLGASLSDLHGNGTITATEGALLDADIVFDATHGTSQSLSFGSGGTLNLNINGGEFGVGYKQTGSLTVSEGVAVSSSGGILGRFPGSTGTATVTGAGSQWINNGGFLVGYTGNGTLTIEAGGEVSSSTSQLGVFTPDSTGTATVTGHGSKWTNSGLLYVGDSGSGTLTIEAGGEVSNITGLIGVNAGSSGTAIVSGIGSKWTNSDFLYVGVFGTGSLTVSDGGQVVARTLVASLNDLDGNGTITATNGAILDADIVFDAAHGASQSLSFGSGGTLNFNANGGELGVGFKQSGTLTISEGVKISSSAGYLGENSGSIGTATVTGEGSQWASSSLQVGNNGVGTLTIEDGGLVSVAGTLAINGSNSFINMTSGGMLALFGDADDSLAQFLALAQGNDAIRFWNDSLSDWAPLTSATLGVDYWPENFSTGDLAGYTLLTVGEADLPGDFNRDGQVDASDYVVWRNGLGTIYAIEDYHDWRHNYGATAPGRVAVAEAIRGASLPEPASAFTFACAAFALATAFRHYHPSRRYRFPYALFGGLNTLVRTLR